MRDTIKGAVITIERWLFGRPEITDIRITAKGKRVLEAAIRESRKIEDEEMRDRTRLEGRNKEGRRP